MKALQHLETIVGLDIGTSQVTCVVGECVREQSLLQVIGFGISSSTGIKKGMMIDMNATVENVTEAVERAEVMIGREISSVYVGISGAHIRSMNVTHLVPLKEGGVAPAHLLLDRSVLANDKRFIEEGREIFHVIPQEYQVDAQLGIHNPVGMSGRQLSIQVHCVTGAAAPVENQVRAVNRAGLSVQGLCFSPMAAAQSVLYEDEKELGVLLVDMGAGKTDLAVFRKGMLVQTAVLPVGGDHFTGDLAIGLCTPLVEAEKLKIQIGTVLSETASDHACIEISGVGDRQSSLVSRRKIGKILESRAEELFLLIEQELLRSGYRHLIPAGAVFIGGGSLLEGVLDKAKGMLQLPVKRGYSHKIGGLREVIHSPRFSVGTGLVCYGAQELVKRGRLGSKKNIYHQFRSSVRDWMKGLF